MEKTLNLLTEDYDNPYVSFFKLIKKDADQSLLTMIDFISKNTKKDINQLFFNLEDQTYIDRGYCSIIRQGSILDLAIKLEYKESFDWKTKYPQQMFQKLFDLGLDFTKESEIFYIPKENNIDSNTILDKDLLKKNSVKYEVKNEIFTINNKEENKSICIIDFAYQQMPHDSFVEYIKKYSTLHESIMTNKLSLAKFLIEKCKISPNFRNENEETPIFFAKNIVALEFLGQYNIDWFAVNNKNKDFLSIYAGFNNREESKKMIDFAQKKASLSNINSSEDIEKRIKKTLLEMVKSDKTKKDLEDFIKKYNIKEFKDILDEDGSSLAQVCLKNGNWARYNIFKNHYDLAHENENKESYLEILFSKNYVKRESDAKLIVKELINNQAFKDNKFLAFNIINKKLSSNSYNSNFIPSWVFSDNYRNYDFSNRKNFLKNISDNNLSLEKDLDLLINSIKKQQNSYGYNYGENINKIDAYILMVHAITHGNMPDFSKLDISNIQSSTNLRRMTSNNINERVWEDLKTIIEVGKMFNYFDVLKIEELDKKVEEKITKFFLLNMFDIKKDLKDGAVEAFLLSSKDILEYYLSKESLIFKEIVNEEFVEYINKTGNEKISTLANYVLLNKKISSKQNLETKKVKI